MEKKNHPRLGTNAPVIATIDVAHHRRRRTVDLRSTRQPTHWNQCESNIANNERQPKSSSEDAEELQFLPPHGIVCEIDIEDLFIGTVVDVMGKVHIADKGVGGRQEQRENHSSGVVERSIGKQQTVLRLMNREIN